jgi:hypothetical protein
MKDDGDDDDDEDDDDDDNDDNYDDDDGHHHPRPQSFVMTDNRVQIEEYVVDRDRRSQYE